MDIKKEKISSEKGCTWLAWGAIGFGAGIAVAYIGLILSGYTPTSLGYLDYEKTGYIGSFLVGTVGILWSLGAVLLYYSALKVQKNSLEVQVEYIQRQQLEYDVKRHDEKINRAIDLVLDFFERESGSERASNGYVIEWSLTGYEKNKSEDTFLNNTKEYRSLMTYLFKLVTNSPDRKDKAEYSRLILSLLTFGQRNCLALIASFDSVFEKILLDAECKFPCPFSKKYIEEKLNRELLEKTIS